MEKAKAAASQFVYSSFTIAEKNNDLQLVYTGVSNRNETCFYVFNVNKSGFVIISADDRFRPIVGYSEEGPFETENMSPEMLFYLDKIIEARTSGHAVMFDDTEAAWKSLLGNAKTISRNGGKEASFLVSTKWNQDSPYNLYAPEANGGPGGRCYAGCVATAMSQVMKYWNHPLQGTGSHTYNAGGWGGPYYPNLSANFGETVYDWENMPIRINSNSPQEEIEAVATLMYHCGVAVDMGFAPDGSGASSWDVPVAIRRYFSYTNQASLRNREEYSLEDWQDMLKESIDIGWPLYYSGYSESGGHAFVCDGYDDNDLFHFNWGWGGSSDGFFVIDEIDYAGWAAAIFNYVPKDVYTYMPLRPENFEVVSLGDNEFSATLSWTNPEYNIHNNPLTNIDQIVITRNGEIIYSIDNATPGADMNYTDHYMPAVVNYGVYAVVHNAKSQVNTSEDVVLGPSCRWSAELSSSDAEGWNTGYLSVTTTAGVEIARLTALSDHTRWNMDLPLGHVYFSWKTPSQAIENLGFSIKDAEDNSVITYEGPDNLVGNGLFFIADNSCSQDGDRPSPSFLTITKNEDNVVLNWEGTSKDMLGYSIYRDGAFYDFTSNTSYTDYVTVNSFHTYFVTILYENGESEPSNTCQIQLEETCEAPSNLRYELVPPAKIKLIWDAPQGETPTGYIVYRRTKGNTFTRIKLTSSPTYTDNLNGKDNERYDYTVCAYYQATDCESAYCTTAADPTGNYISVNKTIIPYDLRLSSLEDGSVLLEWEPAIMAESYNVYCNGSLIAEGVAENTFNDTNREHFSATSCRYVVTGKTAFLESSPTNEVIYDNTAVVETNDNDYELYPNPTFGTLNIKVKNLDQVHVYNLMGQEVLSRNVNADTVTLDLSNLPKGYYFVKTVTNNDIRVEKIILR